MGTLDAGNGVVAANVFSGAIDEPLASTTGGTAKALYSNHQGSVMAVADGGALTNSYRYSPYGETVAPRETLINSPRAAAASMKSTTCERFSAKN